MGLTRIYVTGRFEIECGGTVVSEQRLPGRQGRLLMAYLICHRQRPMTREELANAVWPESLPRAWESALNALVSKLRTLLRNLPDPSALSLTTAFGTYMWRTSGELWVDREAAAEAIDLAEGMLRAGDPRGAWAPGNVAAIISRRPFLPGEEGAWIDRERATLHGILVRALDCLSETWAANGEPALALASAREVIALEPFRELGYQRLIRLNAGLGNHAEALRVYESCRQLLAEELGTDPSRETQQLFLELLRSP